MEKFVCNLVITIVKNIKRNQIMEINYINPTEQSARELFSQPMQGEVVMLNLLRFKDIADYSQSPDIAPRGNISGKEAFQRYINETLPILKQSGGELLFLGNCNQYFIGPQEEKWDMVMLVKQHSLDTFLSFAQNPLIQQATGHREAALTDARLLPIWETQ